MKKYGYNKLLVAAIVVLSACIAGIIITILVIYNSRKNAYADDMNNIISEVSSDTNVADERVKEDENTESSKYEGYIENKDEKEQKQKYIDEAKKNIADENKEDHELENAKPETDWGKALIKEVEKIKVEYGNGPDTTFDLVDINGDDIPELITFDTGGRFAKISIYKSGEVVTQKLFDNKDNPEGFMDYGADASIQSSKHRIVKKEYDTTYENGEGLNKPGAELMEPDGRAYDSYKYITVYEINEDKDMTETDKYSCHYHYNEMGPEFDPYSDYQEPVFVESHHNETNISEDEYKEFEESTWSCDVGFGSAQDASYGLSIEQIEKLLNGEKFIFDVNSIYAQNESGDMLVILTYEYPGDNTRILYDKNVMLSKMPSGIKEGDKICYSIYTGWEKKE